MTDAHGSFPANPTLLPEHGTLAVPSENVSPLNSVVGTIRWLKSYGVPVLANAEKTHAHRRPDGTLEAVNFSVGVLIEAWRPQGIMSEGGQKTIWVPATGVTVSCTPGPISETHYQLQYSARIRPADIEAAKAISVRPSPDRTWAPKLVGQNRIFDPSVNPISLSDVSEPGDPFPTSGVGALEGSSLSLTVDLSFTVVDFEMRLA